MRSPLLTRVRSLTARGILLACLVGIPAGCTDSPQAEPLAPGVRAPAVSERGPEPDMGLVHASTDRLQVDANRASLTEPFLLTVSYGHEAPTGFPVLVEYGPWTEHRSPARTAWNGAPLEASGSVQVHGDAVPVPIEVGFPGHVPPRKRRIWARVVHAGVLPVVHVSPPRSEAGPGIDNELKLRTDPGGVLGGLVLGPTGDPVVGAEVHLRRQNPGPFPTNISSAITDHRGRFMMAAYRTAKYVLIARAEGVGNAILPSLPILIDDPDQDLVVRLRGTAVVRGIVRDQRDRPVVGVPLNAFEIDPEQVEVRAQRGMPVGSTISDARGRFTISGLRAGQYHVTADAPMTLITEDGFGAEVVDTRNARDVVLRLDARRIWVSCVDASGVALPWRPASAGDAPGELAHVLETRTWGLGDAYGAAHDWRPTHDPSIWALWVGANGGHRVVLGNATFGWQAADATVDLKQDPARLNFELPEPVAPAHLSILVDPMPSEFHNGYLVRVDPHGDIAPIQRFRIGPAVGTFDHEFAPDTYTVSVIPMGMGATPAVGEVLESSVGLASGKTATIDARTEVANPSDQ